MNEELKASIIEYLREKGHATVTQITNGIGKEDYQSEIVNILNAMRTTGEVTAGHGTGKSRVLIYSLAPDPVPIPAKTMPMQTIFQANAQIDLMQSQINEWKLLGKQVDAWQAMAKRYGAVSPYGLGNMIDGLKAQISDKSAVVASTQNQPRQPMTVTNIRGSCVDGQGCVTLFFDRLVHARSIKFGAEDLADHIDMVSEK